MNWIKAFTNDLLNGFSANDIPVFLSRIFITGLVAFTIKFIYNRKYKSTDGLSHIVALAMAISVTVPVSQFSISIGLILAAIIVGLFINIKPKSNAELIYAVIAMLSAVSIGSGYVIYSLVGLVVVLPYLIITKE